MCHIIGIIFAFPLLIVHGTIRGVPILLYFIAIPLTLYILDSFFRRVKVAKYKAQVVLLSAHDSGKDDRVVQIVVNNPQFKYSVGQYAEINIPQLSKSEWHPFTIASAPNTKKGSNGYGDVEFFVKSAGKWTGALYELASRSRNNQYENGTKVIAEVGIRGPFGAPAQNYFDYQHIVVIGSGIGVTPLLSIWKHIVSRTPKVDPESSIHTSVMNSISGISHVGKALPADLQEKQLLESISNPGHIDVAAFEGVSLNSWKGEAAFYASILESMTVNVILFTFSILMETIVFCVWLFKLGSLGALLQVRVICFFAVIQP